jgi:hypothetical protein
VTDTGPRTIVSSSRPRASAPKKRAAPIAVGAARASHISSSVHAIGCHTATTTASKVRAIMMTRNGRFPNPAPDIAR